MAATPSPNYNDKQLLAADATFQNRVRQALLAACVLAKLEGNTVPFHRERETFIVAVVQQFIQPRDIARAVQWVVQP